MRAAAICLVMVTHYAKVPPICGVLGVELFFVLSGFLIGGILYRTIQLKEELSFKDLRRFWVRRWLRTLPNYFLFLGIFALYNNTMTDQPARWEDVWRYLFFLQNFAWPTPVFYGVSWSLAVEEWFYFLFPASLFTAYVWMARYGLQRRAIFLACVAFFFICPTTLRLWAGESLGWRLGMRTIVIFRFDALMIGVILAVIKQDSAESWKQLEGYYPAGIALLIVGVFLADGARSETVPFVPAAWLLSIIPSAFALILPWAISWHLSETLWSKSVQTISRYSYSMYLCHRPILWLIMYAANDPARGLGGKLLIRLSAVAGTIVSSGLLYRYFEQPILSLAPADRYSPLDPRSQLAPAATLVGHHTVL